jgi:hypothetical protein
MNGMAAAFAALPRRPWFCDTFIVNRLHQLRRSDLPESHAIFDDGLIGLFG